MGREMFSIARLIMTVSLGSQRYRGMELRKQIFLRTCGTDFTLEVLTNALCRTMTRDASALMIQIKYKGDDFLCRTIRLRAI